MNIGIKLGTACSALFLLAACETPPIDGSSIEGQSVYGEDSNAYSSNPAGYDDFVANVGDRVFFATDSSVLGSDAQATLRSQAEWLSSNDSVSVIFEGHCDERGTREYNLALGERRANAAYNYMISLGVPASRLSTVSYGKERPAVVGGNAAAWSQNRRAVTVLSAR